MRKKSRLEIPGIKWDQPNGIPTRNQAGSYFRTGIGTSGPFQGYWVAEAYYAPNANAVIRVSYQGNNRPGALLNANGQGDLINMHARDLRAKYAPAMVNEKNVRLSQEPDPIVAKLQNLAKTLRTL